MHNNGEHASDRGDGGPADEAIEASARVLSAMGEPGRLRLLERLLAGERCVSDLADELALTLPILSQRLRILYAAGLLGRRREGRHVFYRLTDTHVRELVANALIHGREPVPSDG